MLLLCVLLIIVGASVALPSSNVIKYDLDEAESHFEEFVVNFDRHYESEKEKKLRYEIFKINLRTINKLNALRTQEYQATHGITLFADYTKEEFESLSCLRLSESNVKKEVLEVTDTDYPEELDWSKKNKVTSVKNQLWCGSCWAFAGVANIESQYAIKNSELIDLSEQQVVDCDKYDDGCDGGDLVGAANYSMNNGGLESFHDYPYKSVQLTCKADITKVKVKVSNLKTYLIKNEIQDFKKVLNEQGPVVIGVFTGDWKFNTGGILDAPSNKTPNHAVLLVGYGVEKGVSYWIVKNSWGTKFGNKGYLRIRSGNNSCNIKYLGAVTAII